VSAFIDEQKASFGVELICASIDVSASAYYQRATGERSARAVEDERLLAVIRVTHAANYEAYGSRRMWKALHRAGEDGAALPGRAPDGRQRPLWRQAPRPAMENNDRRPRGRTVA